MKKSTQTALWVVGGAAVLYYLMKQQGAASPAYASNTTPAPATGACNLVCQISSGVSSLVGAFS